MLFLPQAIFDARSSLWRAHNDGDLSDEQFFQKILELDPDDYIGLAGMGRIRREAGELEAAEEYFWRAIRAHPCVSDPYLELGGTRTRNSGNDALSTALGELGIRKRDPEDLPLDKLDLGKAGRRTRLEKEFAKLPRGLQVELIVAAMQENREGEPVEVTERMRPLRLIQDLQDKGILDSETVDEIVGEGNAIAPLLVGVLRDWAQDCLEDSEESDSVMESALALLGETGSPADIPHVLEFTDLEHQGAAGCAEWALGRIVARDPGGAARTIESLAAGLSSAPRMALAGQILRNPALDPEGKLLQRFSENLNEWDPAERDDFFPLLLGVMAMARGGDGIGMARGALMRQGGLLSRAARRECETLLSGAPETDPPQLPPLPFTIYEICAGEVPWEELADDEEAEEEEYEEDPFLLPPEPVRQESKRGRNDPCWCKSGKKYKKCHLESDERERQARQERGEVQGASSVSAKSGGFNSLRTQIGKFLYEAIPKRELIRAAEEFAGGRDSEAMAMLVADWQVHDWIVPSFGRTVLRHFLKQRGQRLSAREREMVEAWSQSYVGFYEVQGTKPGTGIELKDILSGETVFVHDVATSNRVARWDGLFARVVPGERGAEVTGAVEILPRRNIEPIREWMEEDRAGESWPEYLKANWPRIRRQAFDIAEERLESMRLANTDGEELLFSKAVYSVADEQAVLEALRGCSELEAEENGDFVWLNNEKTVLGRIMVKHGRLDFECNSKQRLERGRQLLARLPGNALQHLRDEFTTQRQLRANARSGSGEPVTQASSIPKETADEWKAGYYEEHYSKWPDMNLPALDGNTPREAARTARGRKQLDAVLKDIENTEDRKRQAGEVYYDVGKLRAELGM